MFRFTDLIIFQLTRDCNMGCKYCLMTEKSLYKGEIIDFEIYKKIIDRIIEQRLLHDKKDRLLMLNFHGGEPLMVSADMLYKLADYATYQFENNGLMLKLGVQSNGVLVTDEICQILNKFDMSIGVSLDGFGSSNNLRMENSKKLYLDKINTLKENHVYFGIMPVAHKKNINKLTRFKKFFMKNYSVGMTANILEDPYVDNDVKKSKLEITGKQYFKNMILPGIKEEVYRGADKDRTVTKAVRKALYDIICVHGDSTKSGCSTRFCGAGMTMIAVHPDGDVHYCDRYTKQFKESFIENALDYDFLALHQLKMAIDIAHIKSEIIKKTGCDNCRASYICSYGCLSMYYSTHNKKYGIRKDIVCDVYKPFYDYINRNLIKIIKAYAKNNKPIEQYGDDSFIVFKQDVLDRLAKHKLYVKYFNDKIYAFSKEEKK